MREPSEQLEKIFTIGRRMWTENAELRTRFGDLAELGYWAWLMTEGYAANPELRALLPVPPSELRSRVVLDPDPDTFHRSGVEVGGYVFTCLADLGFDPAAGGALLDFGCGVGRLLRFFARLGDSVALHGADVDSASIAWCQENLRFARFEPLTGWPPAPYPDGAFDALYACSVLTHLDEPTGRAWLEDFHRITKPAAALVLTVQGRNVVDSILRGDTELRIPTAEQLRADLPRLERGELVFYPYDFTFDSLPADMPSHGMTYAFEPHVRAHWADLFEIVDYREAADGWQDYVLLRRR